MSAQVSVGHAHMQREGGGGRREREREGERERGRERERVARHLLQAPLRDSTGAAVECEGCSLHINGKTSGVFGPVYRCPTPPT